MQANTNTQTKAPAAVHTTTAVLAANLLLAGGLVIEEHLNHEAEELRGSGSENRQRR